MTFLELAGAIDETERGIGALEGDVQVALNNIEALRLKHVDEMSVLTDVAATAERARLTAVTRLNDLYHEMHVKLPGNSPVVKRESNEMSRDLKQLFLDGQKTRQGFK